MAHMGPTPCQFDNWNCQLLINVKKYKIVFKQKKQMAHTGCTPCQFDKWKGKWEVFINIKEYQSV